MKSTKRSLSGIAGAGKPKREAWNSKNHRQHRQHRQKSVQENSFMILKSLVRIGDSLFMVTTLT